MILMPTPENKNKIGQKAQRLFCNLSNTKRTMETRIGPIREQTKKGGKRSLLPLQEEISDILPGEKISRRKTSYKVVVGEGAEK